MKLINKKFIESVLKELEQYKNAEDLSNFEFVSPLKLRNYQQIIFDSLFKNGIKRALLVLPRRAGKEVISWLSILHSAINVNKGGYHIIIYPTAEQGRNVLWNGTYFIDDEFKRFRSIIPNKIVSRTDSTRMVIELVNGSVIGIQGSDASSDKIRGTNACFVILSEFGFYKNADTYFNLLPMLRQNNGTIIIQSTLNGMNHLYHLYNSIRNNDKWLVMFKSALDLFDENGNRWVTEEMIDKDRLDGLPDWKIDSEYYSKISVNDDSKYFSKEIREASEDGRIDEFTINPSVPLHTFWDLGINDQMAVIMAQIGDNGSPIIVNYLEDNNKSIQYYINAIKDFSVSKRLIIGDNFLPHDGNNRNLELNSVVDLGRKFGMEFKTIQRIKTKIVGIEFVRAMIPRTKFNQSTTQRLVECLSTNYRQYDEELKSWTHVRGQDTQHGVDAFQTMAIAVSQNFVSAGDGVWFKNFPNHGMYR